tara:strand:- start:268 stop:531 length:264 start_codon:yes stop_codon:yes gene_type:complete
MNFKITKQFQKKLESILISQDYKVRFEKGNFKSGFCLINKNKIAIINKYFTIEGKINSLVEIINQIEIDHNKCDDDQIKILKKIKKN